MVGDNQFAESIIAEKLKLKAEKVCKLTAVTRTLVVRE